MVDRSAPVVRTVGLGKTFKDFWRRARVEAVSDLNLEIRPGEVFGLLGPNGSGKTTTIKMLLGLLYPTRGRISVLGKPPTDVSVKGRIGFLPEDSYLYRYLVAGETLDFYGRLFRLPARIRRDRCDRLLDMVGLRHEARRPVGEYSKGMARRIGLAQALINDPEFLILDEPTSGLDPIGARQIKDVIKTLGRKGKTILLSSHVLADVEDVCDRVTILYGGTQRAAGDIHELLRERNVTQVTMPTVSEETLAQVRDLLRRLEHKDILEVSNPRLKLEDFFLRIVSEAQAANVRTYGARGGGDLPEFLAKPSGTGAESVIDSLVTAASKRSQTVTPSQPPKPTPDETPPSQRVIDDLLGKPKADSTGAKSDNSASASALAKAPDVEREAPAADRDVIDALLHGDAKGEGERES